jgi:hypothetical protein
VRKLRMGRLERLLGKLRRGNGDPLVQWQRWFDE